MRLCVRACVFLLYFARVRARAYFLLLLYLFKYSFWKMPGDQSRHFLNNILKGVFMSVYVQQPAWAGAGSPPGGLPGSRFYSLDEVNSGSGFWNSVMNSEYINSLSNPKLPDEELSEEPERPVYLIPSKPVLPEYINAEFAKHYGMDVATAYQEALANTAHQREVKDLQAAGLNPVLSARYSGASGVSGASVMQTSGSSGSRDSSFEEGSSLKFLGTLAILAGTVAGIATKNPKVGYGVTNAISAIDRLLT